MISLTELRTIRKECGGFNFTIKDGQVVKDTVADRIHKIWSRPFRTERALPVADLLTRIIQEEERLPPSQAKQQLSLKIARKFRKNVLVHCDKNNPAVKELAREETAALLGISSAVMEDTSYYNFARYAKETVLDSWLACMNHTLKVNTESLQIMYGGEYKDWNHPDIQTLVDQTLAQQTRPKYAKLTYGYRGMRLDHMFEGDEPRVFNIKSSENCKGRYVFICDVHAPRPGITDNHVWWKLRNPDGVEYALSFYRPDGAHFTCSIVPGAEANEDCSEGFRGYSKEEREIEIGERHWKTLWQMECESLQRRKKGLPPLPFHNLHSNCTKAMLTRLNAIGINPPDFKVCAWRVFAPRLIVKICLYVDQFLPKRVHDIAYRVIGFVGNVWMYVIGGAKKHEDFVGEDTIKPSIESWRDLFDPEKLQMYSPYYFQKIVFEELDRWREEQKRLRPTEARQIDFEIPPDWKTPLFFELFESEHAAQAEE